MTEYKRDLISKTTVSKRIKQFQEIGSVSDRVRFVRPKSATSDEDCNDASSSTSVESDNKEIEKTAPNQTKTKKDLKQIDLDNKSQKKNKSELLLSFLVDLVNKDLLDETETKPSLDGQKEELLELKLLVAQLKAEKEQQETSLEAAMQEIERLKSLQTKLEEENQCDFKKPLKGFFFSAVINHAKAQDKAVCNRCDIFLKTEAYECSNGHNICGKCKQGTDTCYICFEILAKNWIVNDLGKHLECKSNACRSQQIFRRHHRKCEMRQISCAFNGCEWKGPLLILLDHVREKHKLAQRVEKGNCVVRGFNELKYQGQNMTLIIPLLTHDSIYWNYVNLDFETKQLFSFVKFGEAVVTPVNKISILNLKSANNLEFSYTYKVYKNDADQEEIFKNRKCLIIPFLMLEYFVDEEDNIWYTCEISTVDT